MWTIVVAIAGVFLMLGLWTTVDLLANKHLGERTHRCCCGKHGGQNACETCPADADQREHAVRLDGDKAGGIGSRE